MRLLAQESALISGVMPRSAPEAQGASSAGILKFLAAVGRSGHELHSVMVARHDHIIAEGWWAPYRPNAVHLLYSLTKSFTSTAVGFAVAEGLFEVSDPVTKFFPQDLPPVVSENLAALRVEHLLTMSSGHADETNATITTEKDWAKAFLRLPIEHAPGSVFFYDSGNSYMLSAIVQKLSGKKLVEYLEPRLFQPLGIRRLSWETCPLGINIGGWGLSVTTETLARFGQLYLQQGQWNGKELLPRAWVEEATSARILQPLPAGVSLEKARESNDWVQGYGYQFWRCRHHAFRGDGAFGQFCMVLPDEDAVVAITSSVRDMQGVMNLVWDHLLPALGAGASKRDAKSEAQLKRELASLALPLPVGKSSSPTARAMKGRLFKLAPNSLGAQSALFDFDGTSCLFRLQGAKGPSEIRCGLGKWVDGVTDMPGTPPSIREIQDPVPGMRRTFKVAAAGAWRNDTTLEMQWRFYETPHHDTVTCRFDGERVTLQFMNSITQLQGAQSHPETRPVLQGTAVAAG